jgi:hypothetical protein
MYKGSLKQAEVWIVESGASHMLSGVSRIQSERKPLLLTGRTGNCELGGERESESNWSLRPY